jgi:cell division protein FtsB
MLDFSRPLDLNRIEVDMRSLIDECLAIVEENAKAQTGLSETGETTISNRLKSQRKSSLKV